MLAEGIAALRPEIVTGRSAAGAYNFFLSACSFWRPLWVIRAVSGRVHSGSSDSPYFADYFAGPYGDPDEDITQDS
jgi:hypothetical protein